MKASSGGGRSSARETVGAFSRCNNDLSRPFQHLYAGRVAAGAIAEKYLRIAHGIEIVAFVSSVGKVHLPATVAPPSLVPTDGKEDDEAADALSTEFRQLLATVTRAEVDKHPTRCPHPETAERMTKVTISVDLALVS